MAKAPKERRQWVAAGNPASHLDYGGEHILDLSPGTDLNAENLSIFVERLNAAGLVLKRPKVAGLSVATLPKPTNDELARMCLGKVKMNEKSSKLAAARYGHRAYPCPVCHGWHCTHLNPDWRATVPGRARPPVHAQAGRPGGAA